MAKVFGAELAKEIENDKQRTIEIMNRRDERINNWETDEDDCFLSIHSNQQNISACDMKLEILKGDGTMEIDAIFDENGIEVNVHSFPNKWGGYSLVGKGIFASSERALLKKTGWTTKKIKVPCWVKFCGGAGGGMCAVYSGSYQICRWHTNMVTGECVGFPD